MSMLMPYHQEWYGVIQLRTTWASLARSAGTAQRAPLPCRLVRNSWSIGECPLPWIWQMAKSICLCSSMILVAVLRIICALPVGLLLHSMEWPWPFIRIWGGMCVGLLLQSMVSFFQCTGLFVQCMPFCLALHLVFW